MHDLDSAGERLIMHSRYDKDGKYLSVSEGVRALLGYDPSELVGRSAYEHFHPEDLAIIAAAHARVLGLTDTTTATYRIRRHDGTYRSVTSTSVQHRHTVSGDVEIDSVTTPARLELAPASSRGLEQDFAYLVERATSMVAVLEVDGARIVYANPLLESAVGLGHGTLAGANFFELIHPRSLAQVVGALSVLLHHRGTTSLRCQLRGPGGASVPVSMIVQDLTQDPAVQGLLIVAHDASAVESAPAGGDHRRDLAEPSTEVVDRFVLLQRLAVLLEAPGQVEAGLALATIRLDDLDTIGAAFGAAAAADVFRQATQRMVRVLSGTRDGAEVAQLGLGTLAVVFPGLPDLATGRAFGERLRDILGLAFFVGENEVFLAPRVTVAIARPGTTAEGLLAASHTILEQAAPGTRTTAFHATRNEGALARVQLRTDLHHAIERQELVLHYQPCFSLAEYGISSAEALVRWQHPTRGLLAPGEFLHMAEESDFILPLGTWVLQAACQQLAAWTATLPVAPAYVAVNVSTHQLLDARFPEAVSDALTLAGLSADRLCLEITETAALDPSRRVSAALEELLDCGVQLAIDDFGTGHANLSYLKRIPAGIIKIDRSFVTGLDDDDPDDAAIVAGTIAMAHALGRTVTAEGVETARQLNALREFGCDHVQGYLLSRPVAADQFNAAVLTAQF